MQGFSMVIQNSTSSNATFKLQAMAQICVNATAEASCPIGTFFSNSTCQVCAEGCAQCNASSCIVPCNSSCLDCIGDSNVCLACSAGYFYEPSTMQCVSSCSQIPGMYLDQQSETCSNCINGCLNCNDNQTCNQCIEGTYLFVDQWTNLQMCVADCNSISSLWSQAFYPDASSQKCMPCQEGCLQCKSNSQCEMCRPFSMLNENGDCQCIFQYSVRPSYSLESMTVTTTDINWYPTLMNTLMPCSVYFKAFVPIDQCMALKALGMISSDGLLSELNSMVEGTIDSVGSISPSSTINGSLKMSTIISQMMNSTTVDTLMLMDNNNQDSYVQGLIQDVILALNLQQKPAIQNLLPQIPLLRPLADNKFLDAFMCQAKLTTQHIFSSSLQDFVNVSTAEIEIQNLKKPVLDLLLGGNFTLKLNQLAFSRKDCIPNPLEDYSAIILKQGNALNLNQSNQTFNSSLGMNGTLSSAPFIQLNTQQGLLTIDKCENTSVTYLIINGQRGFESGYKQIIWNFQSNELPILNGSTFTVSPLEFVIEQMEMQSENKLFLDLRPLLPFVNSSVPSLSLNLTVTATNFRGQQATERASILITQMNIYSFYYPNDTLIVPNTREVMFIPMINQQTCNGSTQMSTDQSALQNAGLIMVCQLWTWNQKFITMLPNCTINSQMFEQKAILTYRLLNPSQLQDLAWGQITVMQEMIPLTCKIQQGTTLLTTSMKPLTLSAVTNANSSQYNTQWMCMQANYTTGTYEPCLNFKLLQGLNLELPPNALSQNSIYVFEFAVNGLMGMMETNCSIQVQTIDSDAVQVVTLTVRSNDVDQNNYLSPYQSLYNFICLSDYNFNQTEDSSTLFNWMIEYRTQEGNSSSLNISQYGVQSGQFLQLDAATFIPQAWYSISCGVYISNNVSNGSHQVNSMQQTLVLGYAEMKFNTIAALNEGLQLFVNPTEGQAYITPFNITAISNGLISLQCSLYQVDSSTMQRTLLYQSQSFTSETLLIPSQNFTLSPVQAPDNSLIELRCIDQSGQIYENTESVSVTTGNVTADQIQSQMQEALNSSNPSLVVQTLQMIQQNQSALNATQVSEFYSSSLNMLMDSYSNSSITQNAIQTSVAAVISIVQSAVANPNISLSSNLVQQSLGLMAVVSQTNLSSNVANNMTQIEPQNQNQTLDIQPIDATQLQTIGQIVSIIIANSSGNLSASSDQQKQAAAILVQAGLQYSANLMPGNTFNLTANESGNLSVVIAKVTQSQTAQGLQVVLETSSANQNVTTSIATNDPVFEQYPSVTFQQIVMNNSVMNDTLPLVPQSQWPSIQSNTQFSDNQTYNATSVLRQFVSDILILGAYASNYTINNGSSYSLQAIEVQNLSTPIFFNMTATNLITNTGNTSALFTDCVYYNVTVGDWVVSECTQVDNSNIQNNTIQCCSYHMTQFSATQTLITYEVITPNITNQTGPSTIQYSDDNFALYTVIAFGSYAGFFVLIGCLLNQKNLLLLYEVETDPKKKMFFDLRDVPTHEPQPYRSERRQEAEPESFGPDNSSSKQQNDNSEDSSDQERARSRRNRNNHENQMYEGGSSEEEPDSSSSQAEKYNVKRKQRNKTQKKTKNQESDQGLQNQREQKVHPKKQQKNKKNTKPKVQSSDSESEAKKKNKKSGSDSDEASSHAHDAITKGEIEETQHKAGNKHNTQLHQKSPQHDESVDSSRREEEHVNPHDLSAQRPLKQSRTHKKPKKPAPRKEKENKRERRQSESEDQTQQRRPPQHHQEESSHQKSMRRKSEKLEQQSSNFDYINHEMPLRDQYILALQVYSKFIGILYRDSRWCPRTNKVFSAAMQLSLILFISGLLLFETNLNKPGAIIATLIIVRTTQILVNLLQSHNPQRDESYCRNLVSGFLILCAFVGSEVATVKWLTQNRLQTNIDTWKQTFIITLFAEIILFDLIIIPLFMSLALTCCCIRSARKFLNPALSLVRKDNTW